MEYSFIFFLVVVFLHCIKERLDETDTVGTIEFANNIIWLAVVLDLSC